MRPQKKVSTGAAKSLKKLLRETKTKADFQRVQCMWLRVEFGFSSLDVAKAVGWNNGTVRRVQAKYLAEGEKALIGIGRGGRHRQNLSKEEESQLLRSFIEKAQVGGVLVAAEVKCAYEKAVGHSVPKSTIYRMLSRHGWRKIAPRPRHPKADPQAQESFKKNSLS